MKKARLLLISSAIGLLLTPGLFPLDLSVEDVVARAVENAGAVRLKAIALQRSGDALSKAKTLMLPRLELQASGSYLSNPPEGVRIEKGALAYAPTIQSEIPVAIPDQDIVLLDDAESTYYKITATLRQPLFTWGKIKAGIEVANYDRDIAGAESHASKLDTRRDVRSAYFGARLAQESVVLLRDAEAISARIVADRESSFAEGLINRQKVLEAKAAHAGLVSQRVRTEEGLATAIASLRYLAVLEEGEINLISTVRTGPFHIDEETAVSKALAGAPEREILRYRVEQARVGSQVAAAGGILRPDLSLNLSLDITGQRTPILGANWTDSWNTNLIISIGTAVTLFDSGESRQSVRIAEQDLNLATLGLEELGRGLAVQVRELVERVRTGVSQVDLKNAEAELAAEQARNAKVSYENELITREEALGAEIGALAAALEVLVARYGLEFALVELERTCGCTVEELTKLSTR